MTACQGEPLALPSQSQVFSLGRFTNLKPERKQMQFAKSKCTVNKSTKQDKRDSTGEKGIGFNSVFKYTAAPHISSSGFPIWQTLGRIMIQRNLASHLYVYVGRGRAWEIVPVSRLCEILLCVVAIAL